MADLRAALRSDPGLEKARDQLEELTGSALVRPPLGEGQQRAAALAVKASQEAKKGNYQAAMDLLNQAEAEAPDFPMIFDYRANVAYLIGDYDTAITALERTLELEPGNTSAEKNLERLKKKVSALGD